MVESLLASHFVSPVDASMTCTELSLGPVDRRLSIEESLLFLFGTLLEEHFAQDVFLLLVRVIVLDVVVVRLIEYAVRVMVAVRVLVPDPTSQGHA